MEECFKSPELITTGRTCFSAALKIKDIKSLPTEYLGCLRVCLILFILLGNQLLDFLLPAEKVREMRLSQQATIRNLVARQYILLLDLIVRAGKAVQWECLAINSQ
jgi:hypothetical protein